MKAYKGVDVQIHIFLTSVLPGADQLHAPAVLRPGKSSRYPLNRRLGGPQNQSGTSGEEEILDPTGTQIPDPYVIQSVASRYTDSRFIIN
jgi:hypothetical protein